MGLHTRIEWCDHSLSPWWGCTKVSPGCAHCYAEGLDARWHAGAHWGKGAPRLRQANFERNALALDRKVAKLRRRVTVFPSMCDPFDAEVPAEWLADFLDVVRRTTHLTWILLTKRPELWRKRIQAAHNEVLDRPELAAWLAFWLNNEPRKNIWMLTSVEDQPRADLRIPALLLIPAVLHGVSIEPQLGLVELVHARPNGHRWDYLRGVTTDENIPGASREGLFRTPCVDWVLCGGESGPGARPFYAEWADDLRRQCQKAGVPFFMKQLGANVRVTNANALDWDFETIFENDKLGEGTAAGARVRLKDRKGGDINEFPPDLIVRQFPGEDV